MGRWLSGSICLVSFLLMSSWAFAEPPDIKIDLTFMKHYYSYRQPLGLKVEVSNIGKSTILINKGFKDTDFYKKMRVIDPAGRLVSPIRAEPRMEIPDAPAVPVIYRDGEYKRVIAYEKLQGPPEEGPPEEGPQKLPFRKTYETQDLRAHYRLVLPGWYSAQVQVSAMTFFPDDPGNINNPKWQGLLRSNTVFFYDEGSTRVEVMPIKWSLSWVRVAPSPVKVIVWPEWKRLTEDYLENSIKLNNVELLKVEKSLEVIQAFFDPVSALKSLGDPQVGERYPVCVWGRLTTGELFGGGTTVQIVK